MAVKELQIQEGSSYCSDSQEIVNTTSLTAYSSPGTSDILGIAGIGFLELLVKYTIPGDATSIVLRVEECDSEVVTDEDNWYKEDNGNLSNHTYQEHTFLLATAASDKLAIPFVGSTRYMRVKYGYVGGTGAGGALRIRAQGRHTQ